jgi:hypothetical protein
VFGELDEFGMGTADIAELGGTESWEVGLM